ncbi:MAG: helix-turn-helix domain-containing protein [Myxococcota bacterium]
MSNRIDAELVRISRRVRERRDAKGLTLQELALRSGVATSTIQKVETAQMIPSVAVILKIARGLGLSAADLVSDGGDESTAIHLCARDRHPIDIAGKMVLERLAADLANSSVDMWRVTLQPGVSSGSEAIQYDGEELVVCEDGCVTFRVGERDHRLTAGDSLHFRASIAHAWRNDGDCAARFIITGTQPGKFRALLHESVASATAVRPAD